MYGRKYGTRLDKNWNRATPSCNIILNMLTSQATSLRASEETEPQRTFQNASESITNHSPERHDRNSTDRSQH